MWRFKTVIFHLERFRYILRYVEISPQTFASLRCICTHDVQVRRKMDLNINSLVGNLMARCHFRGVGSILNGWCEWR